MLAVALAISVSTSASAVGDPNEIFVERLTATTDAISFSPRFWIRQKAHPFSETLAMHSLNIMQRACRLISPANEPITCYLPLATSPFNHIDAHSPDNKFTFYRSDPSATTMCNELGDNTTSTFGWLDTADVDSPTECRWKPNYLDGYIIRAIPPRAHSLGFSHDYGFEICQQPGACNPEDFSCINAYTAVGMANVNDYADARNMYQVKANGQIAFTNPRQFPPYGAGTVHSV